MFYYFFLLKNNLGAFPTYFVTDWTRNIVSHYGVAESDILHCLFLCRRKNIRTVSFVLFVPRERSCADNPPESRLLCSLAFVSTPKSPLLSRSFNLVYFLPTHTIFTRGTYMCLSFLFFRPNFIFKLLLCSTERLQKLSWVPEPKHQGSSEMVKPDFYVPSAHMKRSKHRVAPLCVSTVATEEGFSTSHQMSPKRIMATSWILSTQRLKKIL